MRFVRFVIFQFGAIGSPELQIRVANIILWSYLERPRQSIDKIHSALFVVSIDEGRGRGAVGPRPLGQGGRGAHLHLQLGRAVVGEAVGRGAGGAARARGRGRGGGRAAGLLLGLDAEHRVRGGGRLVGLVGRRADLLRFRVEAVAQAGDVSPAQDHDHDDGHGEDDPAEDAGHNHQQRH